MIIIGHRGVCGYTDENTLPSFQRAIDLNLSHVEFDVYKCKSGELIVFHDNIVDKLTKSSGFIENMTLKQIKKLKTSNNFEIPTLNEVLNLLDKKLVVNIEMKSENISQEIASKIEEYVKKYNWNYEQFIVSSFNHPSLLDFRKLLPEVKIGVLIGHLPVNTSFLLDYAPYCVSLNSEFISKDFVNSVHSKGIKVFVYTVNTQFELDKLKKIDIDGVFSDFPDKID